MAEEGRDYPPTAERLLGLRLQGQFPRSLFSVFVGGCCALAIWWLVSGVERVQSMVERNDFGRILLLGIAPIAVIAIGSLSISLLQCRFKFSPLARNYRTRPTLSERLVVCGGMVGYLALRTTLNFSRVREGNGVDLPLETLLFLCFLIFLAMISSIWSGVIFRFNNQMTRGEILAEGREGEMRPELRQAVSHRGNKD